MTTSQPLFTPTADIQSAGVLLLLAEMGYGPQDDPEWKCGPKLGAVVHAILAAARAGGYTQTDILHTLLVRGERSKRLELMARAACVSAGNDRLAELFESMRKGKQ
jgi:hypothetical protein